MRPLLVVLIFICFVDRSRVLAGRTLDLWGRDDPSLMPASSNGGVSCAACTIVVGLVYQKSVLDSTGVDKVLDRICELFPSSIVATCEYYVATYGAEVIKLLESKLTADQVCNKIDFCTGGATCRLFPAPTAAQLAKADTMTSAPQSATAAARSSAADPWGWLNHIINRFAQDHGPIEDVDGDGFGTWSYTFRGRDWNGRDCDELSSEVYPGSGKRGGSCNGISADAEVALCGSSDRRGVLSIGDSAAAHFRVPPQWLNASALKPGLFDDVLSIVEDELDWPAISRDTGHFSNGSIVYNPMPPGPLASNYQRLLERNRCNHRDYQLMAWNGARVGAIFPVLNSSTFKRQPTDHPANVFWALVGNDVCNGHVDTISHMTSPADFRAAVTQSFTLLAKRLAKGSTVLVTGIVDGRFLYNTMHSRIHPIGAVFKDVTYADVYTYLNCLDVSPCRGWMNTNETLRNATSAHGQLLNSIYPQVIADLRSKGLLRNVNFEYIGAWPIEIAAKRAVADGYEPWDLIEPVDGFHPSTLANFLLTQYLWEDMLLKPAGSSIIGAVNPHNEEIKRQFGDQGGY